MAPTLSARDDGLPARQARRPGPPGHFVPGATAQMLDWYKQGAGGPTSNRGIFELYRQRAEERRRGEAERQRRVRLRVPQGIGHHNMLLLNVGADGTVEMSEAEAESFLRGGCGSIPTTSRDRERFRPAITNSLIEADSVGTATSVRPMVACDIRAECSPARCLRGRSRTGAHAALRRCQWRSRVRPRGLAAGPGRPRRA